MLNSGDLVMSIGDLHRHAWIVRIALPKSFKENQRVIQHFGPQLFSLGNIGKRVGAEMTQDPINGFERVAKIRL
jgi:hypothetical protein